MKALIIDDEDKARSLLQLLLKECCHDIEQILHAPDLLTGVEIIRKHKPDIVFLDIEMPRHSGLRIFDHVNPSESTFEIIFTTAYSEYAIQAFQLNAIAYLLKPIQPEQLTEAVEKAKTALGKSQIGKKLEELKASLTSSNFKKIALPVSDGIKFIEFDDIICFEADKMYTTIFTLNDGKLLISKPLKHFSDILKKIAHFYKPHRSYLINLKHMKQYVNQDGGYVLMEGNKSVLISREKKREFLEIVQNIG